MFFKMTNMFFKITKKKEINFVKNFGWLMNYGFLFG